MKEEKDKEERTQNRRGNKGREKTEGKRKEVGNLPQYPNIGGLERKMKDC